MALAPRHVLFVCGKARMRNPAAAKIVPRRVGETADFGGLSAAADAVLDPDQVLAADRVAVKGAPG